MVLWLLVPASTWDRLTSISEQAGAGGFNQRFNIWQAGWEAFAQSPLIGHGAGSFVSVTGTATDDTAHNAFLSIAVSGGLVALSLWIWLLVELASRLRYMQQPQRLIWGVLLLVWCVSALVMSNEENRITWILFALIVQGAEVERTEAPALLQAA